jgi:hypothetical protein
MSATVGANVSGTYSVRRSLVEGGGASTSNQIGEGTSTNISVSNYGNIPAHFEVKSESNISKIVVDGVTISGSNIRYWNSKTGIMKNGNGTVISYTGDGLYKIPPKETVTFTITHSNSPHSDIVIYHNNWYY